MRFPHPTLTRSNRTARIAPRPLLESLESRQLLADPVTFAVIGDFGFDGQPEADVAARVKSWNPSFVATVGDNNYPSGEASTIDKNIGKHYQQFIYPYKGTYGPGALDQVNHFFPALGNHDWIQPNAKPYQDYFTLPGNERYYTVVQGPVQLFVLDSDPHDPDLQHVNDIDSTENSPMGQWLKNALAASSAPWKIVLAHHSPYSSSSFHGNSSWMQWPYQEWGASAFLTGHDHHYERLVKDNFPYFVNGTGGAPIRNQFKPVPEMGSAVRFATDYGAMKVVAGDTLITFQFITRTGQTIDTYTIDKDNPPPPPPVGPPAPTGLTVSAVTSSEISLRWTDNANNESGYKIERSTDGRNFYPVGGTIADSTSYRNIGLSAGKRYYYRVYAWNGTANSALSNTVSAVPGQSTPGGTPSAPTGLTASAVSSSQINLSWTDNATNENGYRVERSTDGVTWSLFSNFGVNQNSAGVTNLSPGTRYYFRVQALGSSANSGWSNVANTTTLGTTPNPGAPATPTLLSVLPSTTLANTINVSWIDHATNESGYKIERSTDGANFSIVGGTDAGGTFHRNTNLTAGRRYWYRVYAWNAAANSARSAVMSAVAQANPGDPPPPPPPRPTLMRVIPSATFARALNLFWSDHATNESGYRIERSTDGVDFSSLTGAAANSMFLMDSNLTAGQRYYYRVYAWNASGTSAYSDVISAVATSKLPLITWDGVTPPPSR